jgi:hypothetical protein
MWLKNRQERCNLLCEWWVHSLDYSWDICDNSVLPTEEKKISKQKHCSQKLTQNLITCQL